MPPLRSWRFFLLGSLSTFFFSQRGFDNAYSMKPIVWMSVYLVYSVGMFGFFMGVPLFHVALAFPAGCFVGDGWFIAGRIPHG